MYSKEKAVKMIIEYSEDNAKECTKCHCMPKDILVQRSIVEVVAEDLIRLIRKSEGDPLEVIATYIKTMGSYARANVAMAPIFIRALEIADDIENLITTLY